MKALKEILNGIISGFTLGGLFSRCPRPTDCSDVLETNLRIESKIDNLKR